MMAPFYYQLHCLSYRDFRPTLKIAQLLCPQKNGASLAQNEYFEPSIWLNLHKSKIEKN